MNICYILLVYVSLNSSWFRSQFDLIFLCLLVDLQIFRSFSHHFPGIPRQSVSGIAGREISFSKAFLSKFSLQASFTFWTLDSCEGLGFLFPSFSHHFPRKTTTERTPTTGPMAQGKASAWHTWRLLPCCGWQHSGRRKR